MQKDWREIYSLQSFCFMFSLYHSNFLNFKLYAKFLICLNFLLILKVCQNVATSVFKSYNHFLHNNINVSKIDLQT